jgi:hypothetical protein
MSRLGKHKREDTIEQLPKRIKTVACSWCRLNSTDVFREISNVVPCCRDVVSIMTEYIYGLKTGPFGQMVCGNCYYRCCGMCHGVIRLEPGERYETKCLCVLAAEF